MAWPCDMIGLGKDVELNWQLRQRDDKHWRVDAEERDGRGRKLKQAPA